MIPRKPADSNVRRKSVLAWHLYSLLLMGSGAGTGITFRGAPKCRCIHPNRPVAAVTVPATARYGSPGVVPAKGATQIGSTIGAESARCETVNRHPFAMNSKTATTARVATRGTYTAFGNASGRATAAGTSATIPAFLNQRRRISSVTPAKTGTGPWTVPPSSPFR